VFPASYRPGLTQNPMAISQELTKAYVFEEQIEKSSQIGSYEDERYQDDEYSKSEQRAIIHKVDRRLISGLGLLFAVSLMDRTNLGNAEIAGYGFPSTMSFVPTLSSLMASAGWRRT
jgi:hypothetical protein